MVCVAELDQEFLDFARLSSGAADYLQCVSPSDLFRLHLFQQKALEMPAVVRTININPATTTIKGRAWLEKAPRSRLRNIHVSTRRGEWDSKSAQPLGIVLGLEFNIREDDSVAAQPA